MPNPIDTPLHRQVLGSKTTDRFVAGCGYATYMILISMSTQPNRDLRAVIDGCEYSTVSSTIVWLQERGVVIPADILASLEIEDVRHA